MSRLLETLGDAEQALAEEQEANRLDSLGEP
jgi:hypothetical protein